MRLIFLLLFYFLAIMHRCRNAGCDKPPFRNAKGLVIHQRQCKHRHNMGKLLEVRRNARITRDVARESSAAAGPSTYVPDVPQIDDIDEVILFLFNLYHMLFTIC